MRYVFLLFFLTACSSIGSFSDIFDEELAVLNSGYLLVYFNGSTEIGSLNATCSVINHPNFRSHFDRVANSSEDVGRVRVRLNRISQGLFSDFCVGVRSDNGWRWTTTLQLVNSTGTYEAVFNEQNVDLIAVFFERGATIRSVSFSDNAQLSG